MADDFEAVSCFQCGVSFGIPPFMRTFLYQSQITFYCPYGHGLMFRRDEPYGKKPKPEKKDNVVKLEVVRMTGDDKHKGGGE